MKKISMPIDASLYDVRVTWAGLKEDNVPPDFGVVEGFPIDPPDDRAGWLLVEFGVQSTKDADRYWSLWAREKTKAKTKKKSRSKKPVVLKADGDVQVPKKKRGRTKKTPAAATPPNGEGGEAPGFDSIRAEHESRKYCEHTRQMLVDTVNVGEQRDITLEDLKAYTTLCHDCERANKAVAVVDA